MCVYNFVYSYVQAKKNRKKPADVCLILNDESIKKCHQHINNLNRIS